MLHEIQVKTVLNKTKKRDPWFLDDYTINPYSACSFNCLYCYIRGSKYGIHMEDKLAIKSNALEVLEKQLSNRAKKNQHGIIVLSSATDAYLQVEKEQQLTREILKLILKYRFPVHIITKSDLVIRDIDILHEINSSSILPADLKPYLKQNVLITFSFSTIDNAIGKLFEPGATPPTIRLQTLKTMLTNGFTSGVSLMPLIPYISDTGEHLELMFQTFREIGVHYILPASLTLFGANSSDSKVLMINAIEKYYPHLIEKYKRFFTNSNQMPAYYTNALEAKTNELCQKYEIKNRIISFIEE